MSSDIFGDITISQDFDEKIAHVLKSQKNDRDYFTEIRLQNSRSGCIQVEFTISAYSPTGAHRAGSVYLGQLCDLLSAVTQVPIHFYMPQDEDDARVTRARLRDRPSKIERVLQKEEWHWATNNLAALRDEYPRFLAASSWYRKGLIGQDSLENFCCFWRTIERIASSYANKAEWTSEERSKSAAKKCVEQLAVDFFKKNECPEILRNPISISEIIKMRNDLSHGNIPVTLDVIEYTSEKTKQLELAAFKILQKFRANYLLQRKAP